MIREVGKELLLALKAQGCDAFKVLEGPERTKPTSFGNERIVLEHDEPAGDSYGITRRADVNPKTRMTRVIGATLTIYAQDPTPGAKPFEHRRRAEHVLDLVLIALGDVFSVRKNGWSVKGGRFTQPKDLEASEQIGGAVYELSFSFERGVTERTWAGAAKPEITITEGLITTSVVASAQGGIDDDDDPQTPPATAEVVTP